MKICMIGAGYVGLVSGACFADLGNKVYCVDKDLSKINSSAPQDIITVSFSLILSFFSSVDKNKHFTSLFWSS